MSKKFFTIKEVNKYIKDLLSGDSLLSNIWVKGEISNFKRHTSGHIYFSLKDNSGSIKCVMFRSKAVNLKFEPAHGMQVLVAGYVTVYERDGQYQLYCEDIVPAGAGALHMAYEQLKEKLSKEGIFDQAKKRKIPFLPKTIGLVTSLTGAALRDMLSIIKRRSPQTGVLIVPAIVQGQEGPESICQALSKIYRKDVDVIILGRGGGSLEELWCFNDERVVRALGESPVPIISAVGHETDFTLCDFAADCRAATPSMAAELVVPISSELKVQLNQFQNRLLNSVNNYLAQERQRIEYVKNSYILKDPFRLITKFQQELDNLTTRMVNVKQKKINDEKNRFGILAGKLDTLSPLKTMARGYSLCFNDNGQLLRSTQTIKCGDRINVQLNKGQIKCLVEEIKEV